MYARQLFTALLLLLVSGLCLAAPRIEHWQTANGARVYFVPSPELPMVDIQVVFDAGSARDGDKPGVAQLTSALLNEGAGGLDADQLAEQLEGVGARLGLSSHRDMTVATLRSVTDENLFAPALDAFNKIITMPDFPQDAFERERKRMLIGVQAQKQDPGSVAGEAFFLALYGQHPYAQPSTGTEQSLPTITRDDLIRHYRRYYVGSNAVVAIVGALNREGAEALADRVLAGLSAGDPAPPLADVSAPAEGETIKKSHPSTQTHILMGAPVLSRDDADYFTLYVGNHVLGGSGLVSRISEEIREKRGLSYSAYSYFSPMRAAGPYTLGLQTRNESAEEALEVLRDTLGKFIADGPTEAELKAARLNITGGFPLRLSSNSKIVEYIAMIGFYGLPLDYLDTFNDKVDAVTTGQIKEAYQRRVHPDKMVTVIVGGGE